MSPYEADLLAILGGLDGTNGMALRQAAAQAALLRHSPGFDGLRQTALTSGGNALGSRVVGSHLTIEEVYARMAALGDPNSPEPIAFHDPRMFCASRAHLMIVQMQQLGLTPQRAWAISPDPLMNDPTNDPLQLRPVNRDGTPLTDARGQVIWPHHVTPALEVHGSSGTELRLLDPSLMRGPALAGEWHARVDSRVGHSRQVTPLGVAPIDPGTGIPFPGTGFHASTCAEPANPTSFARGRMATAFQLTRFLGLRWFDPNF
jgi:hypothetical protein